MTQQSESEIQRFLSRNSPDGLLLRFAQARIRELWLRQSLTLIGSLTIAVLASFELGVFTATLAVAGDVLDCLVLRAIHRHHQTGPIPRGAKLLAVCSGGIQALTIAICVAICWQLIDGNSARFFAASFLMTAAFNAGLSRRYFSAGAHIRLAIYAATALAMLMLDLKLHDENVAREELFFAVTVLILGYATMLFVNVIEKGQLARNRFELDVLHKRKALIAAQIREQEQAKLAERLALVAKYANDSVLFTAPNGQIEWVNDAFSRITGYSFAEAVGKFPGDILNAEATDPEALKTLIDANKQGIPARVELLNRTRDGRHIWMEVSLSPVPGPDGKPEVFIAVERDVTEAKAHAAALSKARLEAEAAAQAKSQFLAAMSHEIRTPMNGVIGIAELLDETQLDETQRHYVGTIIDSGRALITIINDVLDLSKLQADKMELLAEPFSVNSCVARAVDLLLPSAMKKGLTLSAELGPGLEQSVGDAGRVRQILLNLLGNAVKFTLKGGVKVSVRHQSQAGFDLIEVAVADSGIGIAADRLGQVFESFTQADVSITHQFGGTGLGLTISRILAQRMGGDIAVSSVAGEGSVFTLHLRLPSALPAEAEVSRTTRETPVTDLRVLVAEDNRTNMLITRKLLERCVGSITGAANGRLAVAAYRAAPPDLILMDVSMPELSGDLATREIRAFEAEAGLPRCPIVALTAYAAQAEETRCLEAGMDAVLTKPLVRAELYDLLEAVAAARDHFDLSPTNAVDKTAKGGSKWSTSQRASGTTSGRSTRSSAL